MTTQTKQKSGWLANAFTGSKWDSRITSANTTKKEMWLGYVLGVWGMMMTSSIVNSYFNQYLTDVLGFTADKGAWIAGFMVLFPVISKLIDAVTNLVMAKVIDSTTCKQGKVRPWLLISSPFVLVSVILLFWMPFQNVKAQAIWIVVMFNLYYSVSYTMWNMSKELMPAVSTRNVRQRRNLSMAANIVGNVGTGLVSILFPMILARVCAAVHGDNAKGYLVSMTVFATLAVLCTFVQYFYTRERITEERRNQSGVVGEAKVEIHKEASLLEQARVCLKDKYWIMFALLILVTEILRNTRNIALIYYSGWVVNGNAYGNMAAIQAKFQMIALSPMGPGILLLLPLMKKFGRRICIWGGAILTVIGSTLAYMSVGNGTMIYAGSALAGIGNIAFSYVMLSYMGDAIDHVEWKSKARCDGFTGGLVSAGMMFAVGIAQGLFNLGLMVTGYTQPQQTGISAEGIALFADQTSAAVNWINFSYQGTYVIVGIFVFVMFFFFFDLEKHMPKVSRELQERRVAECARKGIEYIPADELERREIAKQEAEAEEIRVKELKEKCARKGLDFDTENQKVLDKRAAQKAKAEAKALRQARKAKK